MFHLVQFLYQTVLQPMRDTTSSLYDMLSAFFNDDVVLIKLAQACKHVMEFFQNICLRECTGGTSNCIYCRPSLFWLLLTAIRFFNQTQHIGGLQS